MKHLQASKRQNNLKKAFLIMENDVKLNTIILVDDIYTTGATLDELSKELKRAGVKKIYSITVAIGNSL
jgi:predicted amidophosphoribosyltransferase